MPDWYTDKRGRVRVIASSPGFEEGFVGLSEEDKDYLRGGPKNGYTSTAPGRETRKRVTGRAFSLAKSVFRFGRPQ